MGRKRLVRVNELLRREIAEALYRVMNERGFDLSAVTVTRVITSSDLRTARVMVSIRDQGQDRDHMLALLQHHASEMQYLINKHVDLKYTPKLSFERDESIAEGDHVLGIISRMEQDHELPPVDPAAPEPGKDEDPSGDEPR